MLSATRMGLYSNEWCFEAVFGCHLFLFADLRLYKRLCPSVGSLVHWSMLIELERVKTRISAPAHPSATGIVSVSGLVSTLNNVKLFMFIGEQRLMFYLGSKQNCILSFSQWMKKSHCNDRSIYINHILEGHKF